MRAPWCSPAMAAVREREYEEHMKVEFIQLHCKSVANGMPLFKHAEHGRGYREGWEACWKAYVQHVKSKL